MRKNSLLWVITIPSVALYILIQIQKNQESFLQALTVTMTLYFNLFLVFVISSIFIIGIWRIMYDIKQYNLSYSKAVNSANKLLEVLSQNNLLRE